MEELGVAVTVGHVVGAYGGPALVAAYPNGDSVAYVTTAFDCRPDSMVFDLEEDELLETPWFTRTEVRELHRHEWIDAVLDDADGRAAHATSGPQLMLERPEVVCICGSARFADQMRAANRELTFAGVIVLAPGEADGPVTDEQKVALDALHLRKIDLADRVVVVNPGGYVGESTSREIAYARAAGKAVSFTDPR